MARMGNDGWERCPRKLLAGEPGVRVVGGDVDDDDGHGIFLSLGSGDLRSVRC